MRFPKTKKTKANCHNCLRDTQQNVLFSSDEMRVLSEQGNRFRIGRRYQVIECCGCNSKSFRTVCYGFKKSFDAKEKPISLQYIYQYPSRVPGREPLWELLSLPEEIRKIYFEAQDAFAAELHVLSLVGLRMVLESLCRHKRIRGKNLKQKVENLKQTGLVSEKGLPVLHRIRLFGNQSAHALKAWNNKQIGTCFDVIENLLMAVYILPNATKSKKFHQMED